MKRKVLLATILLSIMGVVTILGAAAYRTVTVQAATGADFSQTGAGMWQTGYARGDAAQGAPNNGLPAQAGMGRGGRVDQTDEQLAAALGISLEELQAAYAKANEAALAQAVKDGLITQAQADEIAANSSASSKDGRGMSLRRLEGIDYDALLADALGISVDKLQAARLEARNAAIDQAVADGSMTQEQADLMKAQQALADSQSFQDALQTAYESAVQQAVEDGVITQAQADLILAHSPNGFGLMGGPGGPGGPGGHGGHGGHGGFAPGAGPQAPEQPETETTGNEL